MSQPTGTDGHFQTEDEYKHDRWVVAAILRSMWDFGVITNDEWAAVIRFWSYRGEDKVLPPHLMSTKKIKADAV